MGRENQILSGCEWKGNGLLGFSVQSPFLNFWSLDIIRHWTLWAFVNFEEAFSTALGLRNGLS